MDVRSNVVEGSSQMVTRQQRKKAVDAVIFRVMDNPSLREEILKHVIFGKDNVDRKAACTLRLVDISWNESVLRILRQAHKHLFKLRSAAVDRFVSTFATSAEVTGSLPPLAIPDYFGDLCRPANLENFSNCLTRCGDGLIQLECRITETGRPFKTGLPNWSLPLLHKLQIGIQLDFSDNRPDEEGAVEADDNLSTCLIKSVLSNATALTDLNLIIYSVGEVPPQRSLFTAFQSVALPPSLTKIAIIIKSVKPQILQLLARSPLPKLNWLIIYLDSLPSDGLLFQTLDNCRKSLKTLKIDACGYNVAAYLTRFPLMEQLQEISIDGITVQPQFKGDQSLETCLPKLATLRLLRQTANVLHAWAGSSQAPGVTTLNLLLLLNSKASLTMGAMQLVNYAFPNLRKLEVNMSSRDCSGLEYIFREMRQLTDLAINVDVKGDGANFPDAWDSILTGVPVDVIAVSRADPDFWDNSELEMEGLASIRNLSDLERFSFAFYPLGYRIGFRLVNHEIRTVRHSISDFLFNCALLRMSKLMELHLQRESTDNVSQEMITKWRNEGRSLTFQS